MLGKKTSKAFCAALLLFVSVSASARAETSVFDHFTLIDGTGRAAQPDSAMVVVNGRISWIGSATQLRAPSGSVPADLHGAFVIPGLIDNHIHLAIVDGLKQDIKYYTLPNVERQLRTYAAYGVTAVQILGTDKDLIFPFREKQRAGRPDMVHGRPRHRIQELLRRSGGSKSTGVKRRSSSQRSR
jgi:hypothetical protein